MYAVSVVNPPWNDMYAVLEKKSIRCHVVDIYPHFQRWRNENILWSRQLRSKSRAELPEAGHGLSVAAVSTIQPFEFLFQAVGAGIWCWLYFQVIEAKAHRLRSSLCQNDLRHESKATSGTLCTND